MDHVFVLIHSPLVGPLTWALVAADLRRRGIATVVPELHDTEGTQLPYWRQHVASVQSALEGVPLEQSLVLVGHSGAGPLLPLIGQLAPRRVRAYIFVDAALPLNGMSRLSDMEANAPEFATHLRQHLESGGRYPTWSEDDLRAIIPDERLRQAIVAELRPRPLAFFAEPLPGFAG